MRIRLPIAMLAGLAVTATAFVDPARADAGRVTLDEPRVKGDVVVLTGRTLPGAKVRIARKTPDGWSRVAADRANRSGGFRVRVAPPEERAWVVRAVSKGKRSAPRRIEPVAVDACGPLVHKSDGTAWQCTFVDNFDGTTLDGGKWLAQETAKTGVTNGRSCYVNTPSAIRVTDGTLQLSARRHAEEFTCANPYGSFTTDRTSATVTTKGRFNQTLGRFAFRAKMPTTRAAGAHPALWLYPDSQRYGRWPLSGEIDVAEWYSALPEQVFPSVHYIDGLNDVHTGKRGRFANVSNWHTYVLEWTEKTMSFSYDDRLIWEHRWAPLAPLIGTQPFDQPFNVILTQAWGGLWNAPTAETPDRVTMTVDWVRVWK